MQEWPTTVYVVENERNVRVAFSRLLRSAGLNVVAFCSAVKFFEQANIDPKSCVVADIHMPGMSGLEIPVHLKLCGLKFPVILVTAEGDEAVLLRAGKLVEKVLRKPVDEQDLLGAISAAATSRLNHAKDRGRLN